MFKIFFSIPFNSCFETQVTEDGRIQVAVNVVETDPEKAVMAYIDGLLEVGDDVCDH